jgi:hypothetical protein
VISGTHRSPTALLDVEGLPSAFLESGAPQVFGPASLAGTPDRGSAVSSRTRRRSKEDKKGAKGHRRMPTVDRQENDDFWVPEAEEESDANDADDDRTIVVDREQFKKLSRSDNSAVGHDDNDDEVLRPDIREEIDRREKELEAKRCAEEARRKKEEEDSIPLELELIEKTEFYCTHDHWEDELYSDEEDSSDPVDDLLEAAFDDRGSKQYEYYSEDGATTTSTTTSSSLRSSVNTSSQQRRGRSSSSGRDEEAEPLVQAAAVDNYEEVASTQVLIETPSTPQRYSDSRLRTDSAGIVDVYELVAETTAKPPAARDKVASSGYLDDENEGEDEGEAERRDRQQGYTVVNGRQHLMESRGGKSDHYCYDGDGNDSSSSRSSSSSAAAADRKGKQREAELVREQYKAAIPREEPAAAAGGCLDEEELMAQLLAADDNPVPAVGSGKRPEVTTPPKRSQKMKTKKKEKGEKHNSKSKQQVKQHYKPTQEDNYLEDVVEAVDCLRAEKKSKKAQLRDSLYYTDGGNDGDSSESGTESETESESESDDSDSVDTYAAEDDDDRAAATGGGVQDSGDRRAREVADEEEELFRLALLRTSGEDGKEPSADKEESSGTAAAAATRRVSSPPAVVVSTHHTQLEATTAPANPPLSPINPAKLAYAALASMSPTTSSRLRATDSEDETARSTRSLSAPAARRDGDHSVGGSGSTSISSSTSVIPPRMRSTTQSLMLFADMRFPEHSRKMAVMSKKSDQYLHVRVCPHVLPVAQRKRGRGGHQLLTAPNRLLQDMVTRCQALFPIVATHLVRIQSVYEHRQKLQVRHTRALQFIVSFFPIELNIYSHIILFSRACHQRFVGMQLESQESRKDSSESVRIGQKYVRHIHIGLLLLTNGRTYRNLIPRLQRAIRLARRANFLLYGDVGYAHFASTTTTTTTRLSLIINVHHSAGAPCDSLAQSTRRPSSPSAPTIRSFRYGDQSRSPKPLVFVSLPVRSPALGQMTCDYLYTLISTEELAAIYRGAMLRSSSTSKSSCHVAICSFARARHQLRLSTIELKRANDFLKRTITQRSVLDVLQSR